MLLRHDRSATEGYRPALPLSDLDEVEAFIATLSWGGSIYGWKFFDDQGDGPRSGTQVPLPVRGRDRYSNTNSWRRGSQSSGWWVARENHRHPDSIQRLRRET